MPTDLLGHDIRRPPEPIERTAEIDGVYRYTLTRRWGPGVLLAFCGCNPSDADAERDDPTIWMEIKVAWRLGYDGIIKFNRWPYRSPNMEKVRAWWSGRASDFARGGEIANACLRNDRTIIKYITTYPDLPIIAGWGDLVPADDIREWLQILQGEAPPIKWRCLDVTKSGAPKHPLARGKARIPNNALPKLWSPPNGSTM